MDNVYAAIITFCVGIIIGFIVGVSGHIDIVNKDCEKYGQYKSEKYELVCSKK